MTASLMTPLAWLDSLQGSGIRPGLGRIRLLLRHLGRPERAAPAVIVAGTNGKGSTSATLASILGASGYRTGLYTSPHLVDLRERWMIGGAMIEPALLAEAIETLQQAARATGILPTYFEALTVVAFIAFRLAGCEAVVLEVGMGGRLDATNVVHPVASLITPIGMDHTEYLGNTIRKIAAEKAGIIHRGAVVLTSNRDPVVLGVLRRRAARFGTELQIVHGDDSVTPPLAGPFQRDNIALATAAAHALVPTFPRITEATIAQGVATTRWRGRLERLRVGTKEIWIDGAHNAHAAAAIGPFIDRALGRPRLLVFGIMADKDVRDVAATLFPLFDRILTTDPYPPRAVPAAQLASLAGELGFEAAAIADPRDAFAAALASTEQVILVAGSLYLAGAAIEHFDPLAG
jgi:dihydrofolate synthase/folylpolyglutamate synthase